MKDKFVQLTYFIYTKRYPCHVHLGISIVKQLLIKYHIPIHVRIVFPNNQQSFGYLYIQPAIIQCLQNIINISAQVIWSGRDI